MCIISWTPDVRQWNDDTLRKLIPVLPANPKLFPSLWKRVCDFIQKNDVDTAQKETIWDLFYMFSLATATSDDPEQPSD